MPLNKPVLNKPAVGGDIDVWGGKLNTNVDSQDAFNGNLESSINGIEQSISSLNTNKLEKDTYTGTAKTLNDDILLRLEKDGYVGTAKTLKSDIDSKTPLGGYSGTAKDLDDNKVNKISGKGLSTEDFTTVLKTKLDGIADGAEVNVQSDWSQTDNTQDDFIKNKPTTITQDQIDKLTNVPTDTSTELSKKVNTSDIVNDLTTGGSTKVLSAEQGKVAKENINLDLYGSTATPSNMQDVSMVVGDVVLDVNTGIPYRCIQDSVALPSPNPDYVVEVTNKYMSEQIENLSLKFGGNINHTGNIQHTATEAYTRVYLLQAPTDFKLVKLKLKLLKVGVIDDIIELVVGRGGTTDYRTARVTADPSSPTGWNYPTLKTYHIGSGQLVIEASNTGGSTSLLEVTILSYHYM